MIKINNTVYYTIAETSKTTFISEKTLWKYAADKKIGFIIYGGQKMVPESDVERLTPKNEKKAVEITKNDLQSDAWLKNKNNIVKIGYWAGGKHVQWGDMTTEDITRYWKYIILPAWKKDTKYYSGAHPTNQWLSDAGFSMFVYAFNKQKYFEKRGMATLADFWKKIK